jgi:hypothetical protein
VRRDRVDIDVERSSGCAGSILDIARFEIPVTDDDAMRNTDQVGVGKFDAGAFVPIIQQNGNALCVQLVVEPIRRSTASDLL